MKIIVHNHDEKVNLCTKTSAPRSDRQALSGLIVIYVQGRAERRTSEYVEVASRPKTMTYLYQCVSVFNVMHIVHNSYVVKSP